MLMYNVYYFVVAEKGDKWFKERYLTADAAFSAAWRLRKNGWSVLYDGVKIYE